MADEKTPRPESSGPERAAGARSEGVGTADFHPLIPVFRSASPFRVAMLLLVLAILGYVLFVVRAVTGPLLVAAALAYVLAPLVDRAERVRIPRTVTALGLSLGMLLAAAGVVALIVPLAVIQAMRLLERLPEYGETLALLIRTRFPDLLPQDVSQALLNVWIEIKGRAPEMISAISRYGSSIVESSASLLSGVGSVISAVGKFLLVPLFMFFFLREWSRYRERMLFLLPAPMQKPVRAKLGQVGETLSAYVRGIFTVGSILALIYAVGLSIIGVPLGFIVGVLAGYAYAVPFASPILGIGMSVLFSLIDGTSWGEIIAIVSLFALAGAVEGFVLTPRIVGDFVGLSPLAVILAVLLSGTLFGVGGVVVALPVCAVLNVIARDLIKLWTSSRLYQTGLAPSSSASFPASSSASSPASSPSLDRP